MHLAVHFRIIGFEYNWVDDSGSSMASIRSKF